MKKRISCILVVLILALQFAGCKQKADLSKCPFVNISWTRNTENDTEYIKFKANGEFSYYCACGNSVNDSDLCEGFSYYEDTKTIVLDYAEKTDEAVTEIFVKKCTDDELVLDFKGDVRTFKQEKEESKTDKIIHEDKEYVKIQYNKDIFNYNITIGEGFKTDKVYKIPDNSKDIIYYNNEIFALKSSLSDVNAYYSDDKNYTWSLKVGNAETDNLYAKSLSLSASEIEYLYNMEKMEKKDTIFFEEIDKYAILTKTSKDGLVVATLEFVWHNDKWNWRSSITDESTKGWPEFIFELPKSLENKFNQE